MAHTLTGVPKELGDLKNLEYLNLHDTNLHEVPKELVSWPTCGSWC